MSFRCKTNVYPPQPILTLLEQPVKQKLT